ncbi:MAG: hypothetical protein HY343_11515 [Lentisphaerae bacterium]|nr:hypothetical protein [Lentisphaerota bacterium]
MTSAEVLGLKRSFGFGDRLGLATPGHIEAVRGTSFLPVFAQQSIRELKRTQREPADVLRAAAQAVERAGWDTPWGADADHLQTAEDVGRMAQAGFRMFTLDPSAHVNNAADRLAGADLDEAMRGLEARWGFKAGDILELYRGKTFDVGGDRPLAFRDAVVLKRALVKYGGALAHSAVLYRAVVEACRDTPFEVEISVDETASPTSPLEHLFVGLELKRRGLKVVSVAPRFIGDFEKGVDYTGDIAEFERQYRVHAAVARFCGPYKISIHSGSDKFSLYPILGRLSGEHLHVKTAGTSYLEALRAVCRSDRPFFRSLAAYCRGRYDEDRASYHVSATRSDVPERLADADLEDGYLNRPAGRQILHVTFGAVLTQGKTEQGRPFRDVILEILRTHDSLYRDLLRDHLGRHLRLLEGRE